MSVATVWGVSDPGWREEGLLKLFLMFKKIKRKSHKKNQANQSLTIF
jgi:hypothetical protein